MTYMPQVLQFDDEHPLQEPPVPATDVEAPELSFVKEVKRDSIRLA